MLGNQRQRTIMTYIARARPIPANKEIGHQTDRDLQNEGDLNAGNWRRVDPNCPDQAQEMGQYLQNIEVRKLNYKINSSDAGAEWSMTQRIRWLAGTGSP